LAFEAAAAAVGTGGDAACEVQKAAAAAETTQSGIQELGRDHKGGQSTACRMRM
jgi:hypothetical protein